MTPSRKPSRATVITASVAIGVFGAGAGLGTVIAIRASPIEGQVIRLAAGTYHLDDRAGAWTSQAAAGGDQPVPLSGSEAGSTITGDSSARAAASGEQRVCLTATVDGRAVGAGASGCAALPVLAVAAAAVDAVQRPGNPKSTPSQPPPPKPSSAPKPSTPKTTAPKAPAQPPPAANPVPKAPVQPPAAAPKAPPVQAPAPAPTKKITGSISENGSVVKKAPEPAAVVSLAPLPSPPETKPSGTASPQPTGTLKPALPSGSLSPTTPSGRDRSTTPRRSGKPTPTPRWGAKKPTTSPGVVKPPAPGTSRTAKPTRPPGHLRPILPSTLPQPSDGSSQRIRPSLPVTGPSRGVTLPTTGPDNDPNASQAPDGTVPAPQPLPDGTAPEGDAQLPVFRDPELLRQAREALGLDKGMRYTDENGVWDLNIAPPGTPPCRNYSLEELQALSASPNASPSGVSAPQTEPGTADSPTIPRDSCLWPAFIRWLYAEPAPGQVSNWTKVTGLLKRNLELVLTNPVPAPIPSIQTSRSGQVDQPNAVQPDQPDQVDRPNAVQPDQPGQVDQPNVIQPDQPGQVDQPDSNRYGRSDQSRRSGQPGRLDSVRPGPGQIEPDPDEYTGP
ncbi:hypothetical protein SAMN05216276_102021 [Streptosporangium subroseum]|uniref:Uncharacterized protein n=1 Tax=Streptosporangium subroseum TaxID=106412 RepID=A0A239IMK5_9ACTN|nr:hypothetical protein [Streptosporangium subroseum]SNS94622.1 hypothetical protein SAMN05216276_102021 [Streptosporangium subroseum]